MTQDHLMDVIAPPDLDVDEVRGLLERRECPLADGDIKGTALGGGVSGDVVLARFGSTELVLKRARERLAVEADWRVDPSRGANEARCLEFLASLLRSDEVPEFVFFD